MHDGESELDNLVARGGRTPEEWAALTPSQRLQATLNAHTATSETPPPELSEAVRELYQDRRPDA